MPRRCHTHLSAASASTNGDSLSPITTGDANNHNNDNKVSNRQYYDPNGIQPYTQPFKQSFLYFCTFCVKLLHRNHRKKTLSKSIRRKYQTLLQASPARREARQKQKPRWVRTLAKVNEQRRNLVTLADYSAKIVAPSFTFLTLGALMSSIIPKYSANCITLVATLDPDITKVTRALIGLAASSTLAALLTGGRGTLFWIAGTRANYNVRVKLHRNLLLQEAAFFDSNEVGYLLSRINNDVNKIGQVISFHVNVVTRQFAQFLFGSLYLLKISPVLAAWTFGGIGIVAWVSAVYGAFNRDLAQRVQDTFADATAVAETSLSMSETVRAFNGVGVESDKFEAAQLKALELEEVQAWGYGTHKFISDTLQSLMQGALLLACWQMGRAGGLPAADLTMFIFYTNFVLESSNEVGDQWAKIQGAVGASSSVFDLIRRIPQVRDPAPPLKMDLQKPVEASAPDKEEGPTNGASHVEGSYSTLSTLNGQPISITAANGTEYVSTSANGVTIANGNGVHNGQVNGKNGNEYPSVNGNFDHPHDGDDQRPVVIEMKDMTLKYGAMDVPAIDHANLQIYRGDRVAVVGRSGSGKSSMLRAILRFYDPAEGSVSLGGVPLTEMSRKELTTKVTVVEQEPHLFPMTLLENVLYGIDKDVASSSGRAKYSAAWRERAAVALRRAGLPIHPGNDLNLDLDTRVGDGGRSLSGGQRQRVAIARALVRQPDVLLLDEPTAALDSQSEKVVVEALKTACEDCESMVMVTHRLGVVRSLNVNRVIVMERGKIVESGHPEDLLKRPSGIYASLAREQGIISTDAAHHEPTPM